MESGRKSKAVLRQVGRQCAYCGRHMRLEEPGLHPTRDHTVPRSMGGTVTVWACFDCNNIKGCMTPDAWKAFRAVNPNWWLKRTRASSRTIAAYLKRIPQPVMTAAETQEFLRISAERAAAKAAGKPLRGADKKALIRKITNGRLPVLDLGLKIAHADPDEPISPFSGIKKPAPEAGAGDVIEAISPG